MKAFDVQHPFFRPLWRRLLVVALCLGWATFELRHGATIWAAIFAAIGAYLAWQFFLAFDPPDDHERDGR